METFQKKKRKEMLKIDVKYNARNKKKEEKHIWEIIINQKDNSVVGGSDTFCWVGLFSWVDLFLVDEIVFFVW